MTGDSSDPAGGSSPYSGAYLFLALMVLIGSSTATAAKFAVSELPPSLLPLIRFGVAGLFLLPIALRGGALQKLIRTNPARLLAAAILCVPINQAFFLYGTKLAPTTHVGLIYATCPLFVLAMATLIGQERLDGRRMAGVLTTVAGAVVIAFGSVFQGDGGPFVLWGDLLLLGAVASWGAYLTVNKPLVARHGSLPVLAGTFVVGSLIDLPIAAMTVPGNLSTIFQASTAAWLGIAHLALVVTIFGLTFQNLALRRLDASQVATVGNAAPLLTILWGVWLLGEQVTPTLVVGGGLVLGGIVWTTRPQPLVSPVEEIRPEPCPRLSGDACAEAA